MKEKNISNSQKKIIAKNANSQQKQKNVYAARKHITSKMERRYTLQIGNNFIARNLIDLKTKEDA